MRVRLSELDIDDLGEGIWEDIYARAEPKLRQGAEVIMGEARRNLSRRRGTKRTASPAGEAPEYDSGELSRSLKTFRLRKSKYTIGLEYGSDHPAAGLHEFGGTASRDKGARIYPPRPYLRPAEDRTGDEVTEILEDL